MMYRNNLAIAIKVNGRVLREQGDVVRLPFGSEYSIFLRNMNSVRVQFKLQIDGTDATSDTWIVIAPNSAVEMERFIKNGNWDAGNKFKFIERTSEVEQHRGIGVEDGLVRVEYKKEYVAPYVPPPTYYSAPPIPYDRRRNPWHPDRGRRRWNDFSGSPIRSCSLGISGQSVSGVNLQTTPTHSLFSQEVNYSEVNCFNSSAPIFVVGAAGAASAPEPEVQEAGITVEGSKSNQRFTSCSWFATENETHVMVLHLKGQLAGQPVTQPVTVEKKPTCSSCGKTNKANASFCDKCGTSLISYA